MAPRFLGWGRRPPRYARPRLTLLLQIPGPCRRPVGHGELGRRGPPEPGRGEFSLLRLWQQPADGADPPPKPLGRVLQRGPPAGQCSPPGPCDGLCPPLQTREPGFRELAFSSPLVGSTGPGMQLFLLKVRQGSLHDPGPVALTLSPVLDAC